MLTFFVQLFHLMGNDTRLFEACGTGSSEVSRLYLESAVVEEV